MTEKKPVSDEERFPLRTNPNHEHLWDQWYPLDNKSKRRVCLHPKCRLVEKKDV